MSQYQAEEAPLSLFNWEVSGLTADLSARLRLALGQTVQEIVYCVVTTRAN